MKLSNFQFELPGELLAQRPAQDRDESKLMILNRKEETIEHHAFKDVINYFDEGDVMALNNTKVFPARLFGNKENFNSSVLYSKTPKIVNIFSEQEIKANAVTQAKKLWVHFS